MQQAVRHIQLQDGVLTGLSSSSNPAEGTKSTCLVVRVLVQDQTKQDTQIGSLTGQVTGLYSGTLQINVQKMSQDDVVAGDTGASSVADAEQSQSKNRAGDVMLHSNCWLISSSAVRSTTAAGCGGWWLVV